MLLLDVVALVCIGQKCVALNMEVFGLLTLVTTCEVGQILMSLRIIPGQGGG